MRLLRRLDLAATIGLAARAAIAVVGIVAACSSTPPASLGHASAWHADLAQLHGVR